MALVATFFVAGLAHAQNATWTGNTSTDFNVGGNWSTGSVPNGNTNIFTVNPSANITITNASVTLANTGTGTAGQTQGQIFFSGSNASNVTLAGGNITFSSTGGNSTMNNAIVLSGASTAVKTIASNIVLGNGAVQTANVVNSGNSTSGLLRVSGNIFGGTGGTAGNVTLGFGNTGAHGGNYEVTGNVSAGGASGVIITKRGTGTLTLTGTNNLVGLGHGQEGGTIRINGGVTTVSPVTETASGWLGMSSNSTAPGTIRISAGTLAATTGARALRNSILVDGGNFTISGGTRLSFDIASNATFTLSSGNVQIGNSTAALSSGARFGNDAAGPLSVNNGYAFTGLQTGGNFTLFTSGNNQSSFSLGSNNATAFHSTYRISGGLLDIRGGNATTSAHLTLGGNSTGSYSTFTLTDTGKVVVRTVGNTTVTGVGVQGAVAGAIQNFDMNGGTLVTGHIDATNLRRTGGSAGTFVNNGGTFAPGDDGEAGLTNVIGNLTVNSGTFAVDLGGTSAATSWQNTAAGFYDRINVSGTASLGGLLSLNFIDSFAPTVGNSFTVLTAGSVAGTFSNAASTFIFTAGEIDYNFLVSYGTNNVVLTLDSISAIPEPSTFAAIVGLGVLGVAASRRRRKV